MEKSRTHFDFNGKLIQASAGRDSVFMLATAAY
jgi:hypothetical protein